MPRATFFRSPSNNFGITAARLWSGYTRSWLASGATETLEEITETDEFFPDRYRCGEGTVILSDH